MGSTVRSGLLVATVILSLGFSGVALPLTAQDSCPARGNPGTAAGWEAYRDGDMTQAWGRFLSALELCPYHLGARNGLAYVDMREGRDDSARERFQVVAEADPSNIDAATGLGLLAWRRGDLPAVRAHFLTVRALDPGNETAQTYLDRLPPELAPPPVPSEPEAAEPGPDPEDPTEIPDPPSQEEPAPPAGLEGLAVQANEAWNRGDPETAVRIYEELLALNPADDRALHRTALAAGWADRYEEALALFDRLLEAHPDYVDGKVDRARVLAWRGNLDEAMAALDAVLLETPGYGPALEARAQFQSWAGDYGAALTTYDDLVGIADDPSGILLAQARTLGWASRLDESMALYDSVLAANPENLEARLGQARLLAYGDRISEALERYDAILLENPGLPEALRGRARAVTYAGDLQGGEEAWGQALQNNPLDLVSRLGLAQNLRWQGRDEAALGILEDAAEDQKDNPDYLELLEWVRSTLAPRAGLTAIREGDSDDNAMTTIQGSWSWRPFPGWTAGGELYTKDLSRSAVDLDRGSWGLKLNASYQLDPGWLMAASLGGAKTDGTAENQFAYLRAGITSPRRYSYGGSLHLTHYPLDATAQLVERGVAVDQMDLAGRWIPAAGWQVRSGFGIATFHGSDGNQRLQGELRIDRRLPGGAALGLGHRSFGFEKDLDDFYFDPDYYGLTEVSARWLREFQPVRVLLEGASGAQKIGETGPYELALRLSARVVYRIAPGREVTLSGGYSTADVQTFSSGTSSYDYTAFILGATWVF